MTRRVLRGLLTMLLIISIALGSFPYSSSASSDPYYDEAARKHGNNFSGPEAYYRRIKDIVELSGQPEKNANGKLINPDVYRDYNRQIIYGLPHGDFYIPKDGRQTYMYENGVAGEYQFLGYDKMGEPATNNRYFGGQDTGIFTTYKEVTWDTIPGAIETWKDLTDSQAVFLLTKIFEDGDFKPTSTVTAPPTLYDWVIHYREDGKIVAPQAYIQTAPGFWRGASIRFEYNGNKNWNTIEYPPMGCAMDGEIAPKQETYVMSKDQDKIDLEFTLAAVITGSIVPEERLYEIRSALFSYEGQQDLTDRTKQTPKDIFDGKIRSIVFKKTVAAAELNDGYNKVPITGEVLLESIYDEKEKLYIQGFIGVYKGDLPNLAVTDVQVPESVSPDTAFNLVATVKNEAKKHYTDVTLRVTYNKKPTDPSISTEGLPAEVITDTKISIKSEETKNVTIQVPGIANNTTGELIVPISVEVNPEPTTILESERGDNIFHTTTTVVPVVNVPGAYIIRNGEIGWWETQQVKVQYHYLYYCGGQYCGGHIGTAYRWVSYTSWNTAKLDYLPVTFPSSSARFPNGFFKDKT